MKKFTVGDLKKLLANVPDEFVVAREGHYGEIHEMYEYDFSPRPYDEKAGYPYEKSRDYGSSKRTPVSILSVTTPDIGPDPY